MVLRWEVSFPQVDHRTLGRCAYVARPACSCCVSAWADAARHVVTLDLANWPHDCWTIELTPAADASELGPAAVGIGVEYGLTVRDESGGDTGIGLCWWCRQRTLFSLFESRQ